MPRKPTPRFARRPAARPEELIEAAVEVFGEQGFRATTLEEVAKRAGVSKGTVYLYFSSKDDLFRAMVERKVVTLIAGGETALREHEGTATELLVSTLHRIWTALSRNDMVCLARLVHAELNAFPEVKQEYFTQVVQRHRRLLREIAKRGVKAGEFRAEAVQMIPLMVPALLLHLNQSRALFGPFDPDQLPSDTLRDLAIQFILDGVRPRPSRVSRPRRRPARRSPES